MENEDTGSSQTSGAEPISHAAPIHDAVSPSEIRQDKPERSFKQSEVDHIIKRAKTDAVETFKRQVNEQPQYVREKHPDFTPATSVNNQRGMSEDDVRKLAAEETSRLRDEWQNNAYQQQQEQEAQKVAKDFFTKLSTAKEKYPDFDKVMEGIELPQYSNAVQLSTLVDNTQDVWYHLASDPLKLEAFNMLAAKSPKAAYARIQKLSDEIKANESAGNVRLPNAPLSKLTPSNTGTDNGVLSVGDFRKKYRM